MNFKESKAIYLQIADRICDEILLGQFAEEERIPSVREYATIVEVNANTVMRSFDYLQSQNIIYNKRGIGYFVATGARELIHSLRKNTFLKEELDYFFRQIKTLYIPINYITDMYREFCKKEHLNKYYETYNLYINRTFCSRTLCAGRRNVYDFLFRKAIHFQSTEFARRADNQRSAGLPGGLADSNKAVYSIT